jgi:hypothetical protein
MVTGSSSALTYLVVGAALAVQFNQTGRTRLEVSLEEERRAALMTMNGMVHMFACINLACSLSLTFPWSHVKPAACSLACARCMKSPKFFLSYIPKFL